MIKDILVNLSLDEDDAVGAYAVSFAKLFSAQLHAKVFALVPVFPSTAPMAASGADFIARERAANKKRADAAVSRFRNAAASTGVIAHARIVDATVAEASRILGETARHFDIVVVGQGKPDHWEPEILIEGALFGSGRPAIAIPYIQRDPMKLRHVTVCWDGSRAAARAIGDAMPLLRNAESVDLLSVSTGQEVKSIDGDMKEHLARHSVNAISRQIASTKSGEVPAILNHVADTSSDLIVMGGYGHARLREFVLGGVTRGMLASMTAPVFMSH
jgi:nucleotide-binding universal stress UspA family protein